MTYLPQLLKGMVDPILLSLINELPTYGYQIIKELEKRGGRSFRLKAGTVYPALGRLEKAGLIESQWRRITARRGRRYYKITEKGRRMLASVARDWQDICAVMDHFAPDFGSC